VRESLCEARVELPRLHIPHHHIAMSTITIEPSANNLATIWLRCSLWWVGWKLELSSCVERTPTRETQGDESAMNLRGRHSPEAYSPECVEEEFCEVHGSKRLL
jgi:hypothetical protein